MNVRGFLCRLFSGKTQAGDGFELYSAGNTSAPNVLIFTEHINATYFISFDIPLQSLHSKGEVNFAVVSQQHVELQGGKCWERWVEAFQPNVVIMTRYGHASGRAILDYFRRRGIPVIYHIDDNLLEIPDALGSEIQKRHGSLDVINTRESLLKNCDLIYASTSSLAELFKERFPQQKIFHGIYAPYMGDMSQPNQTNKRKNPVIGYMGSKGHKHDLDLVVPALEQLLEERSELEFEVFGTIKMPKELERFGKRVRSHSVQKSYSQFLASLGSLKWDIGLAPLVDTKFNRCKAPTKFIEYSACGIPVVASDIPVYTTVIPAGGGVLVNGGWKNAISYLLDHPQVRMDAISIAKRHCEQAFALPVLEQQLQHIFATVLPSTKEIENAL